MSKAKPKKSVAKKPAKKLTKKKPAAKKPAAKKPAGPAPTAKGFDGDRLVALLGAPNTDERLVAILRELGYTKPVLADGDSIELKKLGIAIVFDDKASPPTVQQLQFEIRRRWTGHAKYEGRLPFGMSVDLLTNDQATVLAAHAPGSAFGSDWYKYDFPTYEISMGFGKTFVETVFVIAK